MHTNYKEILLETATNILLGIIVLGLLVALIEKILIMRIMPRIFIVRGKGANEEYMNTYGFQSQGFENGKSFNFYSPYKNKVLREMRFNDPNWRFKRMQIPTTKVGVTTKTKVEMK